MTRHAHERPRIDAYIGRAQPFAQPILKRIRKAVHTACPGATETVKWSMPAFEYKGPLVGMAAFKAHCTLGFWKASLMKSVPQDKRGQAMGHFGRFESIDDVPSEEALAKMIKAPADMLAALKQNTKLKAGSRKLEPGSRKREADSV